MIAFPLSLVLEEFVGAPEEESHTAEHRIVVRVDGTTIASWKLAGEDLVRVAFYYVRQFLKAALEKNMKFGAYTVDGPLISIHVTPGPLPLNPTRVESPDGFAEKVEIQKRMGFGAQ